MEAKKKSYPLGQTDWIFPEIQTNVEKQKYLITLENKEPFALAVLWTGWKSPSGELLKTYTINTTEAKGIIREIHNSKLRMPVILTEGNERPWLMGKTKGDLNLGLVAVRV